MLNSLASLFQEPHLETPLEARIAMTCTKWDVAQMITDNVHAELQAMALNNAEDWPRFQRTLVDYAAYSTYAALMKRQLDQLMPSSEDKDYQAVLDKCYGHSPLHGVFREALNKEIDAEIAPLKERFHTAFSAAPTPSLQEAQHQGTVQPQLTRSMSYTL